MAEQIENANNPMEVADAVAPQIVNGGGVRAIRRRRGRPSRKVEFALQTPIQCDAASAELLAEMFISWAAGQQAKGR